jgi:hypothetical protein
LFYLRCNGRKLLAKLLLGVVTIFHFQRGLSEYCFDVFRVHSDLVSMKMRVKTPNDPKLSDRGGWRECCAVGLLGAALVTAVAVRCSAWLGVAGSGMRRAMLDYSQLVFELFVDAPK